MVDRRKRRYLPANIVCRAWPFRTADQTEQMLSVMPSVAKPVILAAIPKSTAPSLKDLAKRVEDLFKNRRAADRGTAWQKKRRL